MQDGLPSSGRDRGVGYRWLIGVVAVYAALFLIYAEKWAFTLDESFHLLAAQLMGAGKRPYLDFVFPQTPWNAYWNAGWMRLLGENWRVPHLFAALFTIGAVVLTARFVFLRFPAPGWRAAAALTAALLTGLNAMVFIYGPLAQAYGIGLFTLVVAYQAAVGAVDRNGALWPAAAGFCVGIAAASSLLSAAAAPVLLVWMLVYNRAGKRWVKVAAYSLGAAIPFAPVMCLLLQGPRQVWFNLVQYHLFFRKLYWPNTTSHDLDILTSWIDSGQALLTGLLAVAGLVYMTRGSRWPAAQKAEFYLCAWLAAALSLEVATAHPTFARYFLLAVPFLAMLAAVGLYAIVSRLFEAREPLWAVLPVALLLVFGLGRSLYDRREMGDWSPYERLARKIDEVTPPNAQLLATEPMYFLTRRVPPPGLEFSYAHEVDLGPAENKLLHIVTSADLKRQVQSGVFATAYSCDDDEISDYGLPNLYEKRVDIADCAIFWDWKKSGTER
jgi:4-amino-4-deoxy-L-arabinose transferase-like glycosyltransferase